MKLPCPNAELVAVGERAAGDGKPRDYDHPGTAGAAPSGKWADGGEGVYLREETVTETDEVSGLATVVVRRWIIVRAEFPVEWEPDDVITLTYRGEQLVLTAKKIARHELDGLPGTVRIWVEDQ